MHSELAYKRFYAAFRSSVLGDAKHFTLERRVLNAALFVSAAVATSLIVPTLAFPTSELAIYLAPGASIIFILLYLIGRRTKETRWLPWAYLAIMYSIVLLDWRFSAGLDGAAPFTFIAFTGIIPLILPPKERNAAYLLVACVIGTIYVITLNSIDVIPQQGLTVPYVHILMIDIIAIATGLSLVTLLVINAHRRSEAKILTLFESLEGLYEMVEERNLKLETATSEIQTLRGMVPICGYCKKVRNDDGFYESVEAYVEMHTHSETSHMLCTDCAREHYPALYEDLTEG